MDLYQKLMVLELVKSREELLLIFLQVRLRGEGHLQFTYSHETDPRHDELADSVGEVRFWDLGTIMCS